jgi:Calcium/calmodulin dependent protein kinase II Association.
MKPLLICFFAILATATTFSAQEQDVPSTIIAMERKAMDAWRTGNPDEFLSISDSEITFFHSAVTEKRIEGLPAVRELYEIYRGRPLFDSYDLLGPKVQVFKDTAILTYRLVTRNDSLVREWDATEVYQRKQAGWRIVHTHFSATKQPAT